MAGSNIRCTGRFDFSDPDGPKFAWSACSVSARFIGTKVSVRLRSNGTNYLLVILDGRIIQPALGVSDEGVFELAYGLSEVEHEITIIKRTEFHFGTVQFLGFDFGQGRALTPSPASNRRIEVIGDSITCGYGSEGTLGTAYDPRYDNAWLAYGAVAGRFLGADCMITGRSGYGVTRGYGGDTNETLASLYDLVLPEKRERWDFSRWIPHLVVVNLGTNDFGVGFPNRHAFVAAYRSFIDHIHGNYPNAKIICCVGPLVWGEQIPASREFIYDGVVTPLLEKGHSWISYLEFPQQKEEDGLGIDWHPSLKTHEQMAKRLADEIRRIMSW